MATPRRSHHASVERARSGSKLQSVKNSGPEGTNNMTASHDGPSDGSEDPVVYDLDADCTLSDVAEGNRYHAEVNGVVEYGVFVDISDSVSGLVHESNLSSDHQVGDELVVELTEIRENGDLSFDTGAAAE